jgi:hypothetical protein
MSGEEYPLFFFKLNYAHFSKFSFYTQDFIFKILLRKIDQMAKLDYLKAAALVLIFNHVLFTILLFINKTFVCLRLS